MIARLFSAKGLATICVLMMIAGGTFGFVTRSQAIQNDEGGGGYCGCVLFPEFEQAFGACAAQHAPPCGPGGCLYFEPNPNGGGTIFETSCHIMPGPPVP